MNGELLGIRITASAGAPAIRDRLYADADRRRDVLRNGCVLPCEQMILATCERFEFYAYADPPTARAAVERLAAEFGIRASDLAPHARLGEPAARHLLRVGAGLESRVVGEPHVLAQVRRAVEEAAAAGTLGPVLSALGRAAVHAGRRVRAETAINRANQSWATIAADLAMRETQSSQERAFVLVGAGEMARSVFAALSPIGNVRLAVVSRHVERAEAIVANGPHAAAPLEALATLLVEADAAILCTSSRSPLVHPGMLDQRPARPLLLMDLGVPPNAEAAIAALPFVRRIHLNDIAPAPCPSEDSLRQAEAVVEEELARFLRWQRARRAAPAIAALVRTCSEDRRRPSVRRALHRRIRRLVEAAA